MKQLRDKPKIDELKKVLGVSSILPVELWEFIMPYITVNSCKKGTVLLTTGKYEKVLRFILSGVIKVINEDYMPFVYGFRSEGNFCTEIFSILEKKSHNLPLSLKPRVNGLRLKRMILFIYWNLRNRLNFLH